MSDMQLKVMAQQCAECLFTKDRIVSGERAAEVINGCKEKDVHFICHKATLAGNQNVCCRAFYETQNITVIRLAKQLGLVRFVTEEEIEDVQRTKDARRRPRRRQPKGSAGDL